MTPTPNTPTPSSPGIDASTVAAYLATLYRVDVPGDAPVILRIGQASPGLASLYARYGLHAVAYVTACNPWGQVMPDPVNERATQALRQTLQTMGLPFMEGVGTSPDGHWHEHSFAVLGLERDAAQRLGRQLQQNAIVWAGADAVPVLELLR